MVRTFDLGHDLWQAVHVVCLCHQALVWHQSNGSDVLHCSWEGNSGSGLALTGHILCAPTIGSRPMEGR